MTNDDMKVSKGLEFPVVALPGAGHMSAKDEGEGALCDGVAGYAQVGDWGGWDEGFVGRLG